jgi:hypothetical protein
MPGQSGIGLHKLCSAPVGEALSLETTAKRWVQIGRLDDLVAGQKWPIAAAKEWRRRKKELAPTRYANTATEKATNLSLRDWRRPGGSFWNFFGARGCSRGPRDARSRKSDEKFDGFPFVPFLGAV